MTEEKQGTFAQVRQHARAARRETRAMFKSLLPPAFWEHAQASRQEARAACQAMRSAVRRQLGREKLASSPSPKRRIDIA